VTLTRLYTLTVYNIHWSLQGVEKRFTYTECLIAKCCYRANQVALSCHQVYKFLLAWRLLKIGTGPEHMLEHFFSLFLRQGAFKHKIICIVHRVTQLTKSLVCRCFGLVYIPVLRLWRCPPVVVLFRQWDPFHKGNLLWMPHMFSILLLYFGVSRSISSDISFWFWLLCIIH
jgi:hypothetical protein